jgi:hypothetical protein
MDELRREVLEEQEMARKYPDILAPKVNSGTWFGMTAVERLFIAIGCFLVTSLASCVLLAVLKRITLP